MHLKIPLYPPVLEAILLRQGVGNGQSLVCIVLGYIVVRKKRSDAFPGAFMEIQSKAAGIYRRQKTRDDSR
jgi:hypothetical protein